MVFWVQDRKYGGRKHPVGTEHRILQANRHFFAVQEFPFGESQPRGPLRRWKNHQWEWWLRAFGEGKDVFLAGRRMLLPEPEPKVIVRLDVLARDLRCRRAAVQVLRDYRIRPVQAGIERLVFEVRKSEQTAYQVTVQRDWSVPPSCTCPDAEHRLQGVRNGSWCKHVIAVLMSRDELRGQLLDLFL
jgi:hypothetical protein